MVSDFDQKSNHRFRSYIVYGGFLTCWTRFCGQIWDWMHCNGQNAWKYRKICKWNRNKLILCLNATPNPQSPPQLKLSQPLQPHYWTYPLEILHWGLSWAWGGTASIKPPTHHPPTPTSNPPTPQIPFQLPNIYNHDHLIWPRQRRAHLLVHNNVRILKPWKITCQLKKSIYLYSVIIQEKK